MCFLSLFGLPVAVLAILTVGSQWVFMMKHFGNLGHLRCSNFSRGYGSSRKSSRGKPMEASLVDVAQETKGLAVLPLTSGFE